MNQLNVVTLQQAKLWLKMDEIDEDDDLIEGLICAAVDQAELYTLQILWQRAISAITDKDGKYRIFEYPIVSIESLVNADSEDVEYETDVTNWYTEIFSNDSGLQTVTFVAGYGWTYDLGSEVPKGIITAIKELITYWYENRDNEKVQWPGVSRLLLDPYRRVTLF